MASAVAGSFTCASHAYGLPGIGFTHGSWCVVVLMAYGFDQGERDPFDFYPTPPEFTEVLLREVNLPNRIWEPACGDGAMVDVLRKHGHHVEATDIQGGIDFLMADAIWPCFAVVTNPPFKLFDEFAIHAYNLATEVSALLVGIHRLGGAQRLNNLWRVIPPSLVIVIPERMKVNGKSSAFNHVWVVWDKRPPRPTKTELRWASSRST